MLTTTIAGVDRSSLIRAKSYSIDSILTSQVDTCKFVLVDPAGAYAPAEGSEVIVTNETGTRVFGGRLVITEDFSLGRGGLGYECQLVDFTRDLDRRLVKEVYDNLTAGAIARDILTKYCPGFTSVGVQDGPVIKRIKFNYRAPSKCIEQLARLIGYEWYVDYYRDVRFFATETNPAPISLLDNGPDWFDLRIKRDVTQIRNRVYVRGASYPGNPMTLRFAGNGKQRLWSFGYKAKDVSVAVNGATKTLGLDNVATGKDFYFNYGQETIRQDDAGAVLGSADELAINFTPLIPIRVVLPDEASINEMKAIEGGDGIYEHVVEDKNIDTKELARLRAKSELQGKQIWGRFRTLTTGWRAGQYLDVNLTRRRLQGRFLVYQATLQYAGELNRYVTTVAFGE